mgnify:CR=1 FL=1
MLKYIIFFLLSFGIINAQTYKEIIGQIITNNKDIKAYKEYLNSINIESKINSLPLNPNIEYSFLSGSGNANGNKQELIISQPFDFPGVYFIKSEISNLQYSTNEFRLKEFKKGIIRTAQNMIIQFVYFTKKLEELKKRYDLSENMLKSIQTKFDKGDAGVLELNKAKSNLSLAKSKMNLAQIELKTIQSEFVHLNGGLPLQLNITDYWEPEITSNFDSLFSKLKEADINYLALENEKKLYDKKLSLAKTGWYPNFDIGYRQENESDLSYKGVRLQMSIPIFENTNKVPKAESELSAIDLRIQSYTSGFYLEKKRLFEKSEQLKQSFKEQQSLVDFSQLDLNQKSYNLGHISLTQFYTDNTMYYDIIDIILDIDKEYHAAISELMIEILSN